MTLGFLVLVVLLALAAWVSFRALWHEINPTAADTVFPGLSRRQRHRLRIEAELLLAVRMKGAARRDEFAAWQRHFERIGA